jgi:CheY-like chemotaxis protein
VNPKLLLADDSVTIQRVIELTFADEDVQVLAVGDGQQAIDRVRTDRPDIVLADVGMPERDGYEVAAFIKGDPELAHIPVLLLTGAFEPVDEARARAVGCDGVLVKPFEPQMVISRVRDLLAGKRGAVPGTKTVPVGTPGAPDSAPAEPAASLEDYFDRLDAALASKGASAPTLDPVPPAPLAPTSSPGPTFMSTPSTPSGATTFGTRAPHADLDLTGWTPPAVLEPAARAPEAPRPAPPPPAVTSMNPVNPVNLVNPVNPVNLDEAFAALLAAEQGHAPLPSVRLSEPASGGWLQADAVPDAVIDAVVNKVIARMGDDSMRAAVLDAAERLVREEIDRIKNAK